MRCAGVARAVLVAELGVPLRALRYIAAGFRAAQPAGATSYDNGGNTPLFLGTMAVLALPEMAALDFALWNAPRVRCLSDILHIYCVIWLLGIAEAFRTLPHVIDEDGATFRTLFFRSVFVPRSGILYVDVVDAPPRGDRTLPRFGVGRAKNVVLVRLSEPTLVQRWMSKSQTVTELLVTADDPYRLAMSLTN